MLICCGSSFGSLEKNAGLDLNRLLYVIAVYQSEKGWLIHDPNPHLFLQGWEIVNMFWNIMKHFLSECSPVPPPVNLTRTVQRQNSTFVQRLIISVGFVQVNVLLDCAPHFCNFPLFERNREAKRSFPFQRRWQRFQFSVHTSFCKIQSQPFQMASTVAQPSSIHALILSHAQLLRKKLWTADCLCF